MLYTVEGINSSVAITLSERWCRRSGRKRPRRSHHRTFRHEACSEWSATFRRCCIRIPFPSWELDLAQAFLPAHSPRIPAFKKLQSAKSSLSFRRLPHAISRNEDYDVLHNPKTQIIYDDARHFVLTTTNKYDIIASDPLDVFVKGTAAIYSKEYFEAVKAHLNPGGMFSLYVPLYETDERTIKSELATFFAAFSERDGMGKYHRRARLRYGLSWVKPNT